MADTPDPAEAAGPAPPRTHLSDTDPGPPDGRRADRHDATDARTGRGRPETEGVGGALRELLPLVLSALVLAILIKSFLDPGVLHPVRVDGADPRAGRSDPRLQDLQRVLRRHVRGRHRVLGSSSRARTRTGASWGVPALAGRGDRRGSAGRRRLHQARGGDGGGHLGDASGRGVRERHQGRPNRMWLPNGIPATSAPRRFRMACSSCWVITGCTRGTRGSRLQAGSATSRRRR